MNIPSNRLDLLFRAHQKEYEKKALEVLRSGCYILGPELAAFETELAAFLGGGECVGLACGLDSLRLAFRVLGIGRGDEVIVQGNTYIATVMGISMNDATPVFIEPDDRFAMTAREIERHITPKTKAILVTHLYGMMTPMDEITALCEKYGLKLVEDCAQALGASEKGKKAGTFGDVGCFSFYPTKNLGAFGDGGAVWVNNAALAAEFRVLRNYGCVDKYHNDVVGLNSRLDELQAGLLRVRLKYLAEYDAKKQAMASYYTEHIRNPLITLPRPHPGTHPVWHQYVIRCEKRDFLAEFLKEKGIGTAVHYPVPPYLSEAYAYLNLKKGAFPYSEQLADTVLSLPFYYGMTREEQDFVVLQMNRFH